MSIESARGGSLGSGVGGGIGSGYWCGRGIGSGGGGVLGRVEGERELGCEGKGYKGQQGELVLVRAIGFQEYRVSGLEWEGVLGLKG